MKDRIRRSQGRGMVARGLLCSLLLLALAAAEEATSTFSVSLPTTLSPKADVPAPTPVKASSTFSVPVDGPTAGNRPPTAAQSTSNEEDETWGSTTVTLDSVETPTIDTKEPEQPKEFKNIICPRSGGRVAAQKVNGFDPVRRYTEISGLVLSQTQVSPTTGNPIMYVVNDGHEVNHTSSLGRMGVYDSGTGDRLTTLMIQAPDNNPNMTSYDFEALTIGVCSDRDNSTCLYIADVGDNVARNTEGRRSDRGDKNPYRILKIREPKVKELPYTARQQENVASVKLLDYLEFDYSHIDSPTKYADCEAVFMDPIGWGGKRSDMYLVTKWNSANLTNTRLFQLPTRAWNRNDVIYSPKPVGNFPPNHDLRNTKWTGADATRDGTVIALTGYYQTYLYLRCPGATVAEALMGHSCHEFGHPAPGQVETSAFSADGKRHLEIPEGNRPTMGWTELVYANYADDLSPNVSNIMFHGLPPPIQPTCPGVEWHVLVESAGVTSTTCRTSLMKETKSDLWCHHSPNHVGIVMETPTGEFMFQDFPYVDMERQEEEHNKNSKTKQMSSSSNGVSPTPSSLKPRSTNDTVTTDEVEDESMEEDVVDDGGQQEAENSQASRVGYLLPIVSLLLACRF